MPRPIAGVSGVATHWPVDADGRIAAKSYTSDEVTGAIAERLE